MYCYHCTSENYVDQVNIILNMWGVGGVK
jgi:hypothetical protein